MRPVFVVLPVLFVVGAIHTAAAPFVADEFDGRDSLGPRWVWHPGSVPTGSPTTSTIQMTSNHLCITPAEGADQSCDKDGYAYVEQDQPGDRVWEVVTKIDFFDPRLPEYRLPFQKVGLALHENKDHWIMLMFQLSSDGKSMSCRGVSQFDPTGGRPGADQYKTDFTLGDFGATRPSVYLRLQKTSKGYLGAFSTDGKIWQDITTFLRNPHSTDGFLQRGKIRLFASGGNTTNTAATAQPTYFDWIRMNPLVPSQSGFVADEFDGNSLGAKWLYGQGKGKGEFSVSDGKVRLAHSPGQDLVPHIEWAQLIMQDAPNSDKYAIVTQVGPTSLTESSGYTGHGIRLWRDQNHWIQISLLKNSADGKTSVARNLVETMHEADDGSTKSANSIPIGNSPESPGPGYFRIDRDGAKFRTLYSFDGTNWVIAADTEKYPGGWVSMSGSLRNLQVQLFTKTPYPGKSIKTSDFEFIRSESSFDQPGWQTYEIPR